MCDMCSDDRFELIGLAKDELFEFTNINDSPDEVAVLDSILFRIWQMGWLDAELSLTKLVDNEHGPDTHCEKCGGLVDDEYLYFMERYGYSRCPHCGRRVVK